MMIHRIIQAINPGHPFRWSRCLIGLLLLSLCLFHQTEAAEKVKVGLEPIAVISTKDGSRLYVLNRFGFSVSVIKVDTREVLGVLPVGSSPRALVLSPDERTLYAVNYNPGATGNSVTAIDTESLLTKATIGVGVAPVAAAITPDGKWLYVANLGHDSVSVIDTASNKAVATTKVGHRPRVVAVTPDGRRVYIVNSEGSSVSVLSTDSNQVTARSSELPAASLSVTRDDSDSGAPGSSSPSFSSLGRITARQ